MFQHVPARCLPLKECWPLGKKLIIRLKLPKTLWRGFEHPGPKWRIPAWVRGIWFWILLALAPNPPEKVESVGLKSPVAGLFSRLNNYPLWSQTSPCASLYRVGLCFEGRGGGLFLAYSLKPLPASYSYEKGPRFRDYGWSLTNFKHDVARIMRPCILGFYTIIIWGFSKS